MSFYNNKLNSKKYFKILDNNFSKKFILENLGMLIGDKSMHRLMKLSEILTETKNVKGDIIEFGIWNGNNLFLWDQGEYIMVDKITVHDPRGYAPKVTGKRLAPRLESLDGKIVFLVDCLFDNSEVFMEQVQQEIFQADLKQ